MPTKYHISIPRLNMPSVSGKFAPHTKSSNISGEGDAEVNMAAVYAPRAKNADIPILNMPRENIPIENMPIENIHIEKTPAQTIHVEKKPAE